MVLCYAEERSACPVLSSFCCKLKSPLQKDTSSEIQPEPSSTMEKLQDPHAVMKTYIILSHSLLSAGAVSLGSQICA